MHSLMESLPSAQGSLQPIDFDAPVAEVNTVTLPSRHEWRVKVPAEAKLVVKIVYGIGEIFGTELINDREYTFQCTNIGIYSVDNVKLEWKCLDTLETQISAEPAVPYIYNLHFALEKMRQSSFDGPRVLVIGESSSGKTSLCKTLCAYALKSKSYSPMYINLNPQEGAFSPPGCVTATPISDIFDVESAMFGQSMTSGATRLHNKQPMVKNFGLESLSENKELYLEAVNQLAAVVDSRLKNDPLVRRSGIIIDTPPLAQLRDDFSELLTIISNFNVNVVVLSSKDNSSDLKIGQALQGKVRHIVKLPTSPRIPEVADVMRRAIQRTQIREYFYGNHEVVLSPYTIGLDFLDVVVWQPRSKLTNQDLPENADMTELDRVTISASNLQHALLAITYAPRKSTPQEVLKSGILGFALVTEVNDSRRKLRILLPVPGRFPDKAIILTAYRYLE